MNFLRKHLINIVFFGGLILLFFTGGLKQLQVGATRLIAGQPKVVSTPTEQLTDYDWQLVNMEGEAVNFSSFKGKTVFINFWATWCGPCVAEFPSIEKLYEDYGDDVAFILVNLDDNEAAARSYLEKNKIQSPVYRRLNQAPSLLASRSIPASFLLDDEGKILIKKIGAANWNGSKVRALLDEIIAKNPA